MHLSLLDYFDFVIGTKKTFKMKNVDSLHQ